MAGNKIAPKTSTAIADFTNVAKNVEDILVEDEVENSFLAYSYMVILSRAIPDARDGMKPVHRRILWSMLEDGYTPDRNHVKSAKIIGAVTGNYHTFGDTACYEAMVRLVQDYSLMVPLVDGHGNFGGEPGGSAAASRYTEARLSKEALTLLTELKENGVEMKPNYDSSREEPVVLPVQFPNLIINGGSGIAVGMASKMAPHNPGEVMDAARWLLRHPNADLDKLMEFVPGPDFPTGAKILGMDAIREAYETGRGTVRIQSKYTIESLARGKNQIVFTEFPYEVALESIVDGIKNAIKGGKLQTVADVKDLTDRVVGRKLVVETKTGVNPTVLVNELFRMTNLEISFGMNNVAIVDGEPKTLGLKEQLEIFIAHRIDVVTRRTLFRKKKKEDRLHILEGMLKALANIDDVIKIIRNAADAVAAQDQLKTKYKVDDIQAEYILSIPLRRLTKYDKIELEDENKKLKNEIAELNKILNDDKVLRDLLAKEMDDTAKIIDRPRRSELVGGALADHVAAAKEAATASVIGAEVADDPCVVLLSSTGLIARTPAASEEADTARRKNGRAKHDGIIGSVATTVRSRVLLITSKGRAFKVDVLTLPALPVASGTVTLAAGMPSSDVVALEKGETIVGIAPVEAPEGSPGIAMGTRDGIVKVAAFDWPLRSDEFDIMGLKDGDEILYATLLKDGNEELVFISDDSSLLHFPSNKVRPQGRTGGGVQGIALPEGGKVLAFNAVNLSVEGDDEPRVVTSTGLFTKVTPLREYPSKGRATGGVRSMRLISKSGDGFTIAWVGPRPVASNDKGDAVALPEVDTRRDGSGVANAAFTRVGSLLERS